MRDEEKTVIVTGASTGIGKEVTKLFHTKGMNLVINSMNQSKLQQAFEELGKPKNIKMLPGDISRIEISKALARTALEQFGQIDILVNNAGIFAPKPFLDTNEEDLNSFLNTNFKGTFFASQAVIKSMIENGGGSIVNVGSVLVEHAIAGLNATAPIASKGAVHALTRQLAAEFGQYNIRINLVAPGIIRTPMQQKIGIEDVDGLRGLQLLNRIGEASEVARAIYDLSMSSFITGEILHVDGGQVAGHRP